MIKFLEDEGNQYSVRNKCVNTIFKDYFSIVIIIESKTFIIFHLNCNKRHFLVIINTYREITFN